MRSCELRVLKFCANGGQQNVPTKDEVCSAGAPGEGDEGRPGGSRRVGFPMFFFLRRSALVVALFRHRRRHFELSLQQHHDLGLGTAEARRHQTHSVKRDVLIHRKLE